MLFRCYDTISIVSETKMRHGILVRWMAGVVSSARMNPQKEKKNICPRRLIYLVLRFKNIFFSN